DRVPHPGAVDVVLIGHGVSNRLSLRVLLLAVLLFTAGRLAHRPSPPCHTGLDAMTPSPAHGVTGARGRARFSRRCSPSRRRTPPCARRRPALVVDAIEVRSRTVRRRLARALPAR